MGVKMCLSQQWHTSKEREIVFNELHCLVLLVMAIVKKQTNFNLVLFLFSNSLIHLHFRSPFSLFSPTTLTYAMVSTRKKRIHCVALPLTEISVSLTMPLKMSTDRGQLGGSVG